MLIIKQGFPEDGELVLCTVTKVQHHAVTVMLDEYKRHGLIHISEISPGRIRNIRDYAVEGKVIVCKVLRVNREKGYIDLSLRRVTDMQKRTKVNEIKQEQKAEKIIEFVGKKLNVPKIDMFNKIKGNVLEDYDSLYPCFEAVVEEELKLESIGIEKETASLLEEAIRQRIKPKEVKIGGEFRLSTFHVDGVEHVKKALKEAEKQKVDVKYLGAGRYSINIIDSNYKDAEKKLEKVISAVTKAFEDDLSESEFVRQES